MGGVAKLDKLAGVGSVLAGKYRIERVVGSGGMGVVAAARHLRLGSRVAVKFMLPRSDDTDRSVARFLREARTVSRIGSSHVARVFDVDLREDGIPYIVMEYLEGETLAAALRRERALGLQATVDDLVAASEALAEAHSLGIVHRDLKPGNLFRARLSGRPTHVLKVLDFGISKTFESKPDDVATVTTGKGFVGSPPYMSPEQITSPGSVDSRTDVWSLGVVLYECLTGSSPFAATTVGATCARILHEEPPPPSSLRADLPKALDERVLRCLARDRAERYDTVIALVRDLAPFGSEGSARALFSMESQWAHAAPPSVGELRADSDRGELSTETAHDAVPSIAGVMQTTFRRLPRGVGAGGIVVLALLGVAVAAALVVSLRGQAPPRSDARAVALAPPVPEVIASPRPLAPSPPVAAGAASAPSNPESSARARTMVRPRAEPPSASASLASRHAPPSAAPPVAAAPSVLVPPVTAAAPSDPEAIYTNRK